MTYDLMTTNGQEGMGCATRRGDVGEDRAGADGAGREDTELEWGRRNVPEDRPDPLLAVRKTEILGCGIPVKNKKSIPPTAEEILRRHVRTIMDRQDLMEKEMFLQLNALLGRIETLEYAVSELRKRGRSS